MNEPEKSFASPTVANTTPRMKMARKTVTLVEGLFQKAAHHNPLSQFGRKDSVISSRMAIQKFIIETRDIGRRLVGVAGFEPAASCSQGTRANQAALHPEHAVYKSLHKKWQAPRR